MIQKKSHVTKNDDEILDYDDGYLAAIRDVMIIFLELKNSGKENICERMREIVRKVRMDDKNI